MSSFHPGSETDCWNLESASWTRQRILLQNYPGRQKIPEKYNKRASQDICETKLLSTRQLENIWNQEKKQVTNIIGLEKGKEIMERIEMWWEEMKNMLATAQQVKVQI